MAKGTPAKEDRNKKIVELKQHTSFSKLAVMFNLSEARIKEIYYRELKRMGLKPEMMKRSKNRGGT